MTSAEKVLVVTACNGLVVKAACSTWTAFDVIQLNSASSAVANMSATDGVLTSQRPKRLDFLKNASMRLPSDTLTRPDHAGKQWEIFRRVR